MKIKSKILKIRNLPKNECCIDCIKAKPYALIVFILLVGILLIWKTILQLLGVVLFVFALFYLLFVKNRILVKFYPSYAVFYLYNGANECYLLFWEDVVSWKIVSKRKSLDMLELVLKDEQQVMLQCYMKRRIKKNLTKFAPQHINIDS